MLLSVSISLLFLLIGVLISWIYQLYIRKTIANTIKLADEELICSYIRTLTKKIDLLKFVYIDENCRSIVLEYCQDIISLNNYINSDEADNFITRISVTGVNKDRVIQYINNNYNSMELLPKEIIKDKANLVLMITLHNSGLYYAKELIKYDLLDDKTSIAISRVIPRVDAKDIEELKQVVNNEQFNEYSNRYYSQLISICYS